MGFYSPGSKGIRGKRGTMTQLKRIVLSSPGRDSDEIERAVNDTIGFGGSIKLPLFTDATRPDATKCEGCIIYSDTDGQPIYSDGTNWRKVSDGSVT